MRPARRVRQVWPTQSSRMAAMTANWPAITSMCGPGRAACPAPHLVGGQVALFRGKQGICHRSRPLLAEAPCDLRAARLSSIQSHTGRAAPVVTGGSRVVPRTACQPEARPLQNATALAVTDFLPGAMTIERSWWSATWHRFLCWPIAGRVHRSCLPKSK